MDNKKVIIFDTTLRDGQQCPGAAMSFENNLRYAQLAKEVGVDVLEAGFPAASKLDFSIVRAIAEEFAPDPTSPTIAALCQMRREQVEVTIEALEPSIRYQKGRVHIYLPVDPELMRASLGEEASSKAKLVTLLGQYCELAVKAGLEVEFSPEGYSRVGENFDFTTDLIRAAVDAGAAVINCPDTIGGACRFQGKDYFVELMKVHAELIAKEFPKREIIWSTHCHNDFGLAVENSINAVFFGPATQIEGCFNGIGERAGNAALEQCIMIIKHFAACLNQESPYYTGIRTEKLKDISEFVRNNMLTLQPHWPITGTNAAKHSAGGHTNAILNNPLAYQPFDPKEVGQEVSLVFGPLSGGNHAQAIIERHGFRCEDHEKSGIAQYLKELYKERRKGITDAELMHGYFQYRSPIKIDEFDYWKTKDKSELQMRGTFFDLSGDLHEECVGKDSALAALKHLVDTKYPGLSIENYHSDSASKGIHALSVSKITVADQEGRFFEGQGEDQDIGKSAMKALIAAVNLAYIEKNFKSKPNR